MNYINLSAGLKGEYKEAYDRAIFYVTTKSYEGSFVDERMTELYDVLLTAENERKPVRNIIGDDYQSFLRSFFSDFGVKERLFSILTALFRVAVILLVFIAIDILASDNPLDTLISGSLDSFTVIGGCGSGILAMAISTLTFAPYIGKAKKVNTNLLSIVLFAVLALIIVAEIFLFDQFEDVFKNIRAGVLYATVICVTYSISYLIGRTIFRYKKFGTFFNISKQIYNKSYFRNIEDAQLEYTILQSLQKTSKKMLSKGKTPEEFRDRIERTAQLNKKGNILMIITLVIICVGSIASTALNSTPMDTAIFALVVIAIEYLIAHFFVKQDKKVTAIIDKILGESRNSGKPLNEYIDSALEDLNNS